MCHSCSIFSLFILHQILIFLKSYLWVTFSTLYADFQSEFSTPHPGLKAILGHWHSDNFDTNMFLKSHRMIPISYRNFQKKKLLPIPSRNLWYSNAVYRLSLRPVFLQKLGKKMSIIKHIGTVCPESFARSIFCTVYVPAAEGNVTLSVFYLSRIKDIAAQCPPESVVIAAGHA